MRTAGKNTRCKLSVLVKLRRKIDSLDWSGGVAIPRNNTWLFDTTTGLVKSKNKKVTTRFEPFHPMFCSIDERNECALASVMETVETPSVAASGLEFRSKILCFSTRLKYCWPFTVTL